MHVREAARKGTRGAVHGDVDTSERVLRQRAGMRIEVSTRMAPTCVRVSASTQKVH